MYGNGRFVNITDTSELPVNEKPEKTPNKRGDLMVSV
jgi:hypothetical protein